MPSDLDTKFGTAYEQLQSIGQENQRLCDQAKKLGELPDLSALLAQQQESQRLCDQVKKLGELPGLSALLAQQNELTAMLEVSRSQQVGLLSGFESAASVAKQLALGTSHADLMGKVPRILSGLESAGDAFKRTALGNMHADLLDKIRGRSATLEWADRMKTVALGNMPADLVGKSLGSLYGFEPAADAFKRWEQDALSARAQRGPELAPLAPAPALRIAPQPTQEPNLVDLIAELERHQQQVLERWMAVFDRERITSGSDKEAASRAAHLIAQNEGEKPGHVWTMIRQSLALRTPDEQAAKQAISQRAADIARQKNAGPRAWVLKEWEDRPDLGQSKASFARQYVPLVKKHFDLLVTEDTIKRDWLPKSGK